MPAGAPTISVEPLAAEDVVAVAQCIVIDAEAFPYASAQFGSQSSSACIWVARSRESARVLGFAAGRARRGELHLEGLAVEPGARRGGIGRALVQQAAARVTLLGLTRIRLHVSVANRAAIALYESEGFTAARRLRDFYPSSALGESRDAYEMTKRLR